MSDVNTVLQVSSSGVAAWITGCAQQGTLATLPSSMQTKAAADGGGHVGCSHDVAVMQP